MRTIEECFTETLSAIQMSNGVVRLFFATPDLDLAGANPGPATPKPKPEPRLCLTMTVPSFLNTMSMINGFVQDPKITDILDRMVQAGLLGKPGGAPTGRGTDVLDPNLPN